MELDEAHGMLDAVHEAVASTVIVDDAVLRATLTGILARGNLLLEDVPGTGKTLTARTLARVLGLSFKRIQFTPDLLPGDVTGTEVFDERDHEFHFAPGPVFANVVLADEINRASPATQSALLEAMDEQQVTVEGTTHDLPDPFFVIATQNPVERGDGTFPLPHAQKDRFLMQQRFGYPSEAAELELLDRREGRSTLRPTAEPLLDATAVRELQAVPEAVAVHADVKSYIVQLVRSTRDDDRVQVGVSPRGTQRLFEASRAHAVIRNRPFVTPDDVKAVAHPLLDHRLVLNADAVVDGVEPADVVADVLERCPAPTVNREAPA